ncbi:MAG: hypothetical protein E4H09_01340 [Spirochaetales bacterium]|nr:MAG: hypothetical protein E4H09_01340 [Spirochaetales bacterium]
MPSHVAHLLFAESVASSLGVEELTMPPLRSFITLGAQGPDIFYHNQRRRPTGLAYGSLMHRHGYGTTVSWMWEWASREESPLTSWIGAWVAGFASHAILDRFTHPFINHFSAWLDPDDPASARYRSMHPFMERLIDLALLDHFKGKHPNDIDFFGSVDCGPEPPAEWIRMLAYALRHTYPKAAHDKLLDQRLTCAYLDCRGYYQFTNAVDRPYLEQGLAREDQGDIKSRWLTIVHPPNLPSDLDTLNMENRQWCHPCNHAEVSTASFMDLYWEALSEAVRAIAPVIELWGALPTEHGRLRIAAAVADWNLSDGRETERPCRKRHANPLPLYELQERIRRSIREGKGGLV